MEVIYEEGTINMYAGRQTKEEAMRAIDKFIDESFAEVSQQYHSINQVEAKALWNAHHDYDDYITEDKRCKEWLLHLNALQNSLTRYFITHYKIYPFISV